MGGSYHNPGGKNFSETLHNAIHYTVLYRKLSCFVYSFHMKTRNEPAKHKHINIVPPYYYCVQYNVLIKYLNGPVSILYLEGLPVIRRAAAALYTYIQEAPASWAPDFSPFLYTTL